jgi:hypothetical protein
MITPFQLDDSANAPWTRTMVGLSFTAALACSAFAVVKPRNPVSAAVKTALDVLLMVCSYSDVQNQKWKKERALCWAHPRD